MRPIVFVDGDDPQLVDDRLRHGSVAYDPDRATGVIVDLRCSAATRAWRSFGDERVWLRSSRRSAPAVLACQNLPTALKATALPSR